MNTPKTRNMGLHTLPRFRPFQSLGKNIPKARNMRLRTLARFSPFQSLRMNTPKARNMRLHTLTRFTHLSETILYFDLYNVMFICT